MRNEYVLPTADHHDALLNQSVVETRVVCGRRARLLPLADQCHVRRCVLGERDVDKGHIHMAVRVFLVLLLEPLGRVAEPLNLVWLDPVVARKFALVGRVRVRVEQVNGDGRVA